MGKEKILIVHNYYQIPGGEDIVVKNEKSMLEKNGYRVTLYTRKNSELNDLNLFRKLLIPFATIFNCRTYFDIKKIMKEQGIDIVHVHNTLNLISPSVYYAARACGVPVVQTIHNFRFLCPNGTFYRKGHICEECIQKGLSCAVKYGCYRDSRLQTLLCVINTKIHRLTGIYGKITYICLTEFNKKKILELKQIKEEAVFIKPNFVEGAEKIIPGEERKNQFIFAGRLDQLKGIGLLLEAWKQMEGEAPKLIVCGTGPMEEWCREFIRQNQLHAELKGFVSNAEVRRLIAESRALILPTQWYEGFPMSIVEAYSVGTPVLGSDIGNVGSIIQDGITGFLFRNIYELIKSVQKIIDHTELYRFTYDYYRDYYTEETNLAALTEIYSQAAGRITVKH